MPKKNNLANVVDRRIGGGHGTLELQVFSNALILKNILKFSNLSSLKAARRVSKFWNEMANPFLKKHAQIIFDIHQNDNNSAFCNDDLPLKVQAFKIWKLRNLKFTSNNENSSPGCYTTHKPIDKLFNELFLNCKAQIIRVELNLKNRAEFSKQIIESLFKECTNIENIVLSMDLSTMFKNGPQPITSAKSLELNCKQRNYEKLLKIFPALEELRVGLDASFHFRHTAFTPVYKEILKNLTIFRIGGVYPGFLEDRHFVRFPVELEELDILNWLPSPNNYCMARFSSSLIKFSANIESRGYKSSRSLYFPKMEKLETLKIRCRSPKNVEYWDFNWELVAATFPKLKRFEVDCSEDAEHLMNYFLAEENRKQFPNLKEAFVFMVEYDEDLSIRTKKLEKNFVTWEN